MELISTFPALPLQYGCKIVFQALHPTTDAPVTGVNVVNPVCYGLDLTGTPTSPASQPVTPLWLPVPTAELNTPDDTEDATSEDSGAAG
jgi:hypothetical protein